MKLITESNNISDYLVGTDDIDYSHPLISEKVTELSIPSQNEVEYVKSAFEFVRDQISHAADIQSARVTYKASDVLQHKVGLCYAKSILLGALLRSKGIPTGFCYQKLTLGSTPDTGYAIHGLNAVYLTTLNRWIRLDARGNKVGVNAQFSLDQEQLAFPIRTHYGEIDYPTIYTSPNSKIVALLKNSTDGIELYQHHLPSELD